MLPVFHDSSSNKICIPSSMLIFSSVKNYIAIDYMSNDPFTKISIRITRNTYKLTMLHRRF